MKNILVTACYQLENSGYFKQKNFNHKHYMALTDLCVKSFKENLEDLDEIIVLDGIQPNYHKMFYTIYCKIFNLYHNTKCNILWVDSDNVCIRPTKIFNLFNHFAMFFYSNQFCKYPSEVPLQLYSHLIPWMMSNVRYYPANKMSSGLWEKGTKLAEKWINVWAYECIIYNKLFHSQGLSKEEMLNLYFKPELNCQYIGKQTNYNVLPYANIIHVQSTRGVIDGLSRMKEVLANVKDNNK